MLDDDKLVAHAMNTTFLNLLDMVELDSTPAPYDRAAHVSVVAEDWCWEHGFEINRSTLRFMANMHAMSGTAFGKAMAQGIRRYLRRKDCISPIG